jgi:hypothetical protein
MGGLPSIKFAEQQGLQLGSDSHMVKLWINLSDVTEVSNKLSARRKSSSPRRTEGRTDSVAVSDTCVDI